MHHTTDPEGLLLRAGAWAAAFVFAWLVLSTLAAALARALRAQRAIRWLDIVTLPVVRRVLDRTLALTFVTSAVVPLAARAAGAAAAPSARAPHVVATAPLVRRHGGAPGVRRHALPFVRRHGAAPLVRRHAPARPLAAEPAPPPTTIATVPDSPIVRGGTTTTTAARPRTPIPAPPAPVEQAAPTPPQPTNTPRGATAQGQHIVVARDNLWTI